MTLNQITLPLPLIILVHSFVQYGVYLFTLANFLILIDFCAEFKMTL